MREKQQGKSAERMCMSQVRTRPLRSGGTRRENSCIKESDDKYEIMLEPSNINLTIYYMKSKLNLLNSNQSGTRILTPSNPQPIQINSNPIFISNRSLKNNDINHEKYELNNFKRGATSTQFVHPDPQKITGLSPTHKYQPQPGSPAFNHKNQEINKFPKPVLQYRHSVDFAYDNSRRQEGINHKIYRKNDQTEITFQVTQSNASKQTNPLRFKPLQFKNLGAYEFITLKKNDNPSNKTAHQIKRAAPRMSLNQESQRYADYDLNEKKRGSQECYFQHFKQFQQNMPSFNSQANISASKSSVNDSAKQCSLYDELQLQDQQKRGILAEMEKLTKNQKQLKNIITEKDKQIQRKNQEINNLQQQLNKLQEKVSSSENLSIKIEELTKKLSQAQESHRQQVQLLKREKQEEISKADERILSLQKEKNKVIDELIFKCCEKDDLLHAQKDKFKKEGEEIEQQFIWKMQQLVQMLEFQVSQPEQEVTAESAYFKFLEKFTDFIQKLALTQKQLKQLKLDYQILTETNHSLIVLNKEQNTTIAEFKKKIVNLEFQWNQLRGKIRDGQAYAFDLSITLQQSNSQLILLRAKELSSKYTQELDQNKDIQIHMNS